MALAKKKYIEVARKRVNEKLTCIADEANIIKAYVDDIFHKAENCSTELLGITNKSQFMDKFMPVMNQLEDFHNQLFLIHASLPDEGGTVAIDSTTSDSEDDDEMKSLSNKAASGAKAYAAEPSSVSSQTTVDHCGSSRHKVKSARVSADDSKSVTNESVSNESVTIESAASACSSETLTDRHNDFHTDHHSLPSDNLDQETDKMPTEETKNDTVIVKNESEQQIPASDTQVEGHGSHDQPQECKEQKAQQDLDAVSHTNVANVNSSDVGVTTVASSLSEVVKLAQALSTNVNSNLIPKTNVDAQNLQPNIQTLFSAAGQMLPNKALMNEAAIKDFLQKCLVTFPGAQLPMQLPVVTPQQTTEHVPYEKTHTTEAYIYVQPAPLTVENIAKVAASQSQPNKPAEDSKSRLSGTVVTESSSSTKLTSSSQPDENKPHKQKLPVRRRLIKRNKGEGSSSSAKTASDVAGPVQTEHKTPATPAKKTHVERPPPHNDYGLGPVIITMNLTQGKQIEVFVIDVESPWLFWVQVKNHKLDTLMAELNKYEDLLPAGCPQTCPPSNLTRGMVVCAQYPQDLKWYRACITTVYSIGESMEVEVFYLDYGNKSTIPASQIRPLGSQFSSLPCLAFPAALANVAPKDGGSQWDIMVRATFTSHAAKPKVYAVVDQIKDCPLVFTDLYYRVRADRGDGYEYINIAQRLIDEHMAMRISNSRIVQWFNARKVEESSMAVDSNVLSFTPPTELVYSASPEMHLRKEVRKKASSNSGSSGGTLADKMKLQEKTIDTSKITDLKSKLDESLASQQKVSSQDELLDDDLDSVLDLELDRRKSPTKHDKPVIAEHGNPQTPAKTGQGARPKVCSSDPVGGDKDKPSTVAKETQAAVEQLTVKKSEIPNLTAKKIAVPHMKSKVDLPRKVPSSCEYKKEVEAWLEKEQSSDQESHHQAAVKSQETSHKRAMSVPVESKRSGASRKRRGKSMPKAKPIEEKTKTKLVTEETNNQKNSMPKKTKVDEKFTLPKPYKAFKRRGSSGSKESVDTGEQVPVENRQSQNEMTTDKFQEMQSNMEVMKKDLCSKTVHSKTVEAAKTDDPAYTAVANLEAGEAKHVTAESEGAVGGEDIDIGNSHSQDDFVKDGSSSPDSRSLSPHSQPTWEDFVSSEVKGFVPVDVVAPKDGFLVCLMSHIVSPSHFYVHLAQEGSAKAVDKLFQDLNAYFREKNVVALQMFLEPALYDRCVARYSSDNNLYRGKIIDMEDTPLPQKFHIFFVDYGNKEWVAREDVYPLPPKFTSYPPQAVCCMLPEIQPKKGATPTGDGDKGDWPQEAIDHLEFLSGYETPLQLQVMLFHDDIIRVSEDSPLGVKLVNVQGEMDVWIAQELVNAGFAEPTHLYGLPNHSITEYLYNMDRGLNIREDLVTCDDDMDNWHPMKDDYTSLRNSYKVDIDDAGVAMLSYKAQDERSVCRFFDLGKPCPRGDDCPFQHVKTKGTITTDKIEVFGVNDVDLLLAMPEMGSWVVVELTAIYTPAHFYTSFPFGPRPLQNIINDDISQDEGYAGSNSDGETFETLRDNMTQTYSKIQYRDLDYTVLAQGEVVAAKFLADNSWYRARVIEADPDNERVKVFYVDFGNWEWIDERLTRRMQPRFMHLPFQCLECHMSIQPATGTTWSQPVIDFFQELVDGRVLFAHVLESNPNGILQVELWDTTEGDEIKVDEILIRKGYAKPIAKKKTKAVPKSTHAPDIQTGSRRMLPG